ncbi:putative bifunctional diguanylate cyclase/phosphodiesterase [Acuticoccus sediminis]|uniref:putative bifunctional diguanylate cyclase/phosphodiesterase n=1 Tax=Acuticoccus sediminis TaxID=2184697 RepID=UPI001CFEDAA1|nr:EAL domain-containing protein [Acuticoccus sediminis]
MVDIGRLTRGTSLASGVGFVLALLFGILTPAVLAIVHALSLASVSFDAAIVIAMVAIASITLLAISCRRRLVRISEAIDAIQCSIAIYDESDRLMLGNRRYCEVLGLPPEEMQPGTSYSDIVRRSLVKYLPPDRIEAELARRLTLHQSADGRPADRLYPNNRWERVTKTRLPSGLNVGIAVDVTEYYTLKDQLDMEARRFSALARGAPVGICLVDEHSAIQFVNDALVTMMGADNGEALIESAATFSVDRSEVKSFRGLIARLRTTLAETEVKLDVRGTTRHIIVRKAFVPIADSAGRGAAVSASSAADTAENLLIFVDITKRKTAEARISYLALHDPLTGALNRVAFAEDLDHASAGADMKSPAALIAIDLDRFKPVNDLHGHAVGDELLCRVVERIGAGIPGDCRLYRIGGDEFAVLCPPPSGVNAMAFARTILERLTEPFSIEGSRILIGASVGISSLPSDTDNPQTLIHYADLALYQGKSRGGGTVHAFSPAVLSSADTRRIMEFELAEALENGDIDIVMQPIFGLDREHPLAAETLARWTNRRTGESISPATFIPVAEAANLITRLDLTVFRRAIATYAELTAAGCGFPTLMVNVSVRTLEQCDVVDLVRETLERHGVAGTSVVMEVTENFIIHDAHRLSETMQAISQFGIRFALDDFGIGYTSLRMLADLPVSYLKIDQSFVRDLSNPDHRRQHRIIRAIVELASQLELHVVAEGIEDEATFDQLRELGCELFQGFLLGRPASAAAWSGGKVGVGKGTAAA